MARLWSWRVQAFTLEDARLARKPLENTLLLLALPSFSSLFSKFLEFLSLFLVMAEPNNGEGVGLAILFLFFYLFSENSLT